MKTKPDPSLFLDRALSVHQLSKARSAVAKAFSAAAPARQTYAETNTHKIVRIYYTTPYAAIQAIVCEYFEYSVNRTQRPTTARRE